jgi:hypothetical protein
MFFHDALPKSPTFQLDYLSALLRNAESTLERNSLTWQVEFGTIYDPPVDEFGETTFLRMRSIYSSHVIFKGL